MVVFFISSSLDLRLRSFQVEDICHAYITAAREPSHRFERVQVDLIAVHQHVIIHMNVQDFSDDKTSSARLGTDLHDLVDATLEVHAAFADLGGRTVTDGSAVTHANSNSFISGGASTDDKFIASASSSLTMFTTNSPVARTLLSVSLVFPSTPRIMGQNTTVGGLEQTTLKNENGARFGRPRSSMLEIQPIGRGRIDPVINL